MRIALAVGGTGGHILPALEFAKQCRQEGIEVHLIGAYLEHNPHLDRSFPYRSTAGSNRCIMRMIRGIWQSVAYLRKQKISFVLGFGSYHSFSPLTAAFLLRIPFSLCEANLFPGKVNRFFSRLAKWTAVQFLDAGRHLFSPIKHVDFLCTKFHHFNASKQDAAAYYSLSAGKPTLLIFGGSLGSASINSQVLDLIPSWQGRLQVIHLVGKQGDLEATRKIYEKWGIPHVVKHFEENMHHAYTLSTFAITRAGAATLAELIYFQLPALLIPYPLAADDHQLKNARYFVDTVEGGLFLQETEWSLFANLVENFFDPHFLAKKKRALAAHTGARASLLRSLL